MRYSKMVITSARKRHHCTCRTRHIVGEIGIHKGSACADFHYPRMFFVGHRLGISSCKVKVYKFVVDLSAK